MMDIDNDPDRILVPLHGLEKTGLVSIDEATKSLLNVMDSKDLKTGIFVAIMISA